MKNIQEIQEIRKKIEKLRYQVQKNTLDHQAFNKLKNYLQKNAQSNDVDAIKKTLRHEIAEKQGILFYLNQNHDIKTIEDLQKKVDTQVGNTELKQEIENMTKFLELLLKNDNLCPQCLGKRTVYDAESASGDPYARSSDYQKTCPVCRGDGQYRKIEQDVI